MFGLFGGKKKSSKPAQTLPNVLHFKGSEAAFEYACRFFKSEIKEKMALTGTISDSASENDTLRLMLETMNKGDNIYVAYICKIASDDGGFKAIGLCYDREYDLRQGDLIFWVPLQNNPAFAMIAEDKRTAWVGGIVAKLAPCYSVSSGSFEIVKQFA
jgi:hypothetical protein